MKIPKPVQLPSGAWSVRIMLDGKRHCITRATEKEALAEAVALKTGQKALRNTSPRDKTLAQAIDEYIDARRNILSPSTIRGYKIIRENRFQSVMGKRIGSITPSQWQSIVNAEARFFSPKTLKNSWGFISSVIHEATGETVNVRLPQVIRKDKAFLEPQQIPAFLAAIKGTRSEIPALLALSSLRLSELLALRWEDVDLKKRLLYVNGAAVLNEDNVLVRKKETKNASSRRTVPIIQPLYDALIKCEDRSGLIVTITSQGIYHGINKACTTAGLPNVGIHGLRHSFASLAYHLQIPEKIAMQIGGWSNDATMRKIYTHIASHDAEYYKTAFSSFFSNIGNEIGNEN